MPNITNRVLTSPDQQLSDTQKLNARRNIDAMEAIDIPSGAGREFIMGGTGGNAGWLEVGLVDDPIS